MNEILCFLGLILINTFVKVFFPAFYTITINATVSLCLGFIVFTRMFFCIIKERIWEANLRQLILCIFFFLLVINASLGCIYFSNVFQYNKSFTYLIQFIIYSLLISVFIIQKVVQFKQVSLYGIKYLVYSMIDALLVASFAILDFVSTPEDFEKKSRYVLVFVLLLLIAAVNLIISYYKDYWMHKKILLDKIDIECKRHNENKLLKGDVTIYNNSIIKEVAYVLDYAPFRVFEVNFIVKHFHDILIKNGKSLQEATTIAAQFSSVIIKTLMKRKYDFSFFPRPIVKLLQTYNKCNDNKREFILSL